MSFIIDNWGSILVGAILTVVISAIIIKMYKDKKNGKTSCGGGCKNCPSSDNCNKN